ncbi:glutamyl-tRNA reductase [Stomatohabitans albus]|uniref:glutamyl-tRNA reductase n=1 Tax=Stomatohabitans albus TaxID=3110766 RepID=UPI00300CCEC4
MAVMMMGASHHNASIDFLECLAIEPARIQSVLQSICDLEEIDEAVLINTCNRKEVYISSRDPEGARDALRHTIACLSRQTGAELDVSLKTLEDEDAARHLFTVACGLDSMVVGEQQILGQVRDAMAASLDAGASGPVLNKLFRQAIHTGRTVRQHTTISEGAHSTVTVALDLAKRYLPKEGSRVLIYGAGMIGGMAARTLAGLENKPDLKPSEVHIANRTEWKAEELAERLSARVPHTYAMPLDLDHPSEIDHVIGGVDLLVTSTDIAFPVFTKERIARIRKGNPNPLVIVDLAVPRDVAPEVDELDNVRLFGIDSLRSVVTDGPSAKAIEDTCGFIEQAVGEFTAWTYGQSVEPTITAMRQRAEEIRRHQLERVASKLGDLTEEQRKAIEVLTHGMVNQFLHSPTVKLKQSAQTPDGEGHARTLAALFDLDVS